MIRKLLLASIVMLVLSVLAVNPALAAKVYSAEQYDVIVQVQKDGSLLVAETIRFRFEGGPFTYVFRELPFRNLDAIDQIQASMDGQALPEGTQPGQVEITNGRPLKVTWHFNPTSDAAHTFTLTYRVQGAIRQDPSTDTLFWRAIPEEHGYPIQSSTIRVEYPAGIVPLSAPTLSRSGVEAETGRRAATFHLGEIGEDDPVDITIPFPPGSLVDQPPAWQDTQNQSEQLAGSALPYGLVAAVLAGILGVIGIVWSYRGLQREGVSLDPAPQSVTRPPRSTAPALAARLTGSSTGFLGTLFDLARRGFLRIEEGRRKWTGRTFEIVCQEVVGDLSAHEQEFIQALFRKAKADRTNLNEIGSLSYNSRFSAALDEELIAAGWRDPERQKRRTRFLVWTCLGLVLGLLVLVVGLLLALAPQSTNAWLMTAAVMLIGGGGAVSGVCLVGLFIAALTSTLSDEGVRQAAAWNSFSGYLRNIARGREPGISPDLFERYLAYAAAFGLATEWVKYFQKQAAVPVPEWFQGLQSGLDDGSFVAIMAAVSSADTSASSAGGDGGASGGGASGAG